MKRCRRMSKKEVAELISMTFFRGRETVANVFFEGPPELPPGAVTSARWKRVQPGRGPFFGANETK